MLEKTMGNFTSNDFIVPEKAQIVINATLAAKDDVKEILSVDVQPYVSSYEALGGEAIVSGRVNVKVLTADKDGQLNSLNYNADFSDRYKNEAIQPNSLIAFDADVVDSTATLEDGAVKVSIVCDLSGKITDTVQASYLSRAEGLVVKEDMATVGRVVATLNDNVQIVHEAELKTGVTRILSAQGDVCVRHAEANDNVLTVEGECTLTLTYVARDGKPGSQIVSVPFREEVNAEGFNGEGEINVYCRVRSTKIHVDILEDAENTTFTAEINLSVYAFVVAEQDVDVCCDAYSTTHEVTLDMQKVRSVVSYGMTSTHFSATGELSVPAESEIVGFCGLNAAVTSVRTLDGKLALEGVVTGTLIATGDGVKSFPFAVPFVHTADDPDINASLVADVRAAVTDFYFRQGRSVTLNIEICVYANLFGKTECTFVADATETEALEGNVGAIEVCIAKAGDSLWEIAKSLRMKQEDITAANPELVTPLEKDEKIVVYHCIAED